VAAVGCSGAVRVGVCDDFLYGVWGLKEVVSSQCSVYSKTLPTSTEAFQTDN
jgi:hypothetical protein